MNDESVKQPDDIKPPVTHIGAIGWIRANLFNSAFNSVLTLLILFCLWKTVPPFVKWAFIDSVWATGSEGCRNADGACWSVIPSNIRFIMFGFYPADRQWRPLTAMILLLVLLMRGGVPGLVTVESTQWGGLPLTLLLSVFGLAAAYPVGIVLALGRQSRMPAIRSLCVIYIEMIRGVPLISLLFMSSIIFPLFLPEGVTINKILRAQVAIIMFTAAYVAEVVRGACRPCPGASLKRPIPSVSTIVRPCG
ncbi:amino acid ABC transporter permease [Desulfonema ishimotonii]|uniref:Amino acid ABC transporter permease n=1 Tax=Desulfonema ishimotonii TaxID=45657 RepID=A0A401G3W8_9BACT|nr:ABC transporter permease subunit [Desulfonema ishimotonii]GBC63938.1 amino acid ABC transporter permease [Desulfonema ishimotonii]